MTEIPVRNPEQEEFEQHWEEKQILPGKLRRQRCVLIDDKDWLLKKQIGHTGGYVFHKGIISLTNPPEADHKQCNESKARILGALEEAKNEIDKLNTQLNEAHQQIKLLIPQEQ